MKYPGLTGVFLFSVIDLFSVDLFGSKIGALFGVESAVFERFEHYRCAACVGGKRNLLHVTKAEQGGNVRLVGLGGEGVAKEDY